MTKTPRCSLAETHSLPVRDLATLLASPAPSPTRIIEVSTHPGLPASMPGALQLSLAHFTGAEGKGTGRQPLPDHAELTHTLSAGGITAGTAIIIVPRETSDLSTAARAWVTLRWAGFADVSVLAPEPKAMLLARGDSLIAWAAAAGGGSASDELTIDHSVVATAAEVADRNADTILIDARGADAFGDANAHIPGAVNLPNGELLLQDGTFGDRERVRAVYLAQLGIDPTAQPLIISCGSGISASVQALALAQAGIIAPVYIGSWSEWRKLTPEDISYN